MSGLWRVGRSPDPLRFSDPLDPELFESRATGNRFDSPTGDYRVCYFATTLDGCYGETLSRFRPDPGLSAIAEEENSWRSERSPPTGATGASLCASFRHRARQSPAIGFLDVEAAETRPVLRGELGELLAFHGYSDLDVPTVERR